MVHQGEHGLCNRLLHRRNVIRSVVVNDQAGSIINARIPAPAVPQQTLEILTSSAAHVAFGKKGSWTKGPYTTTDLRTKQCPPKES